MINTIIQQGVEQNDLSEASKKILQHSDAIQKIQQGSGVDANTYTGSEALLVQILLDDSGSVEPFQKNIVDGYNLILDSLSKTKKKETILITCTMLNRGLSFPFQYLLQTKKMMSLNCSGATPLYENTILTLGQALVKAQEFRDAGINTRTWTLIVTDGQDTENDQSSNLYKIGQLVADMRKQEIHRVMAMGIGDEDFQEIFLKMGISQDCILTVEKTEQEIRRAFTLASQSACGLSGQAVGGFGI